MHRTISDAVSTEWASVCPRELYLTNYRCKRASAAIDNAEPYAAVRLLAACFVDLAAYEDATASYSTCAQSSRAFESAASPPGQIAVRTSLLTRSCSCDANTIAE
jgi:hypothetical protein